MTERASAVDVVFSVRARAPLSAMMDQAGKAVEGSLADCRGLRMPDEEEKTHFRGRIIRLPTAQGRLVVSGICN